MNLLKARAFSKLNHKMYTVYGLTSDGEIFLNDDEPEHAGDPYDCNSFDITFCIGLVDCHGKDIYCGDIIKSTKEEASLVVWIAPCYWRMTRRGTWHIQIRDKDKWEIIGNVFENPELLPPILRQKLCTIRYPIDKPFSEINSYHDDLISEVQVPTITPKPIIPVPPSTPTVPAPTPHSPPIPIAVKTTATKQEDYKYDFDSYRKPNKGNLNIDLIKGKDLTKISLGNPVLHEALGLGKITQLLPDHMVAVQFETKKGVDKYFSHSQCLYLQDNLVRKLTGKGIGKGTK